MVEAAFAPRIARGRIDRTAAQGGRWCLLGLALAVLALAAAPAHAQQRARCKPLPPPFATNAANQIKGEALQRRLTGKTMTLTRPAIRPGVQTQFRFEFRADGSIVMTCRLRRGAGGEGRPCGAFGPSGSGGRDVGVWRVEGDQVVIQRTRFAGQEGRITLHAEGNLLAVRRIAGAVCLPGAVTLE